MAEKIALVLGIRPDVIRASLVIKELKRVSDLDLLFIWSGQHYSDNLKDIFFRELNVPVPDIELGVTGESDASLASGIIQGLYGVLAEHRPKAVIFLGDTNTVAGCLAAAQLNIPIVHIEGCMRSYDWRMPEEKYRSLIDHLSDVIYAYFDEYKAQGISEGLNHNNIIVTGNLIVDVLQAEYFSKRQEYAQLATNAFFRSRGLSPQEYYLMTCHRRENVEDLPNLQSILNLVGQANRKVFFLASYRTQKAIKRFGLDLPPNILMVDPVGYKEMVVLMVNSRGVLTDSGTVVEETAILQVPSVQMRRSTERPQVYDARSSVKFDPTEPERYPPSEVFGKLERLVGTTWEHGLGDGLSSKRIVDDIVFRFRNNSFAGHQPKNYHLDISRSYQGDGL